MRDSISLWMRDSPKNACEETNRRMTGTNDLEEFKPFLFLSFLRRANSVKELNWLQKLTYNLCYEFQSNQNILHHYDHEHVS